jgi:hypothetical protein
MGKYGTNVTGLGAYEGGVNNDKGAPLVANNTDGETSLLFGPAALREIQTGVANGSWEVTPDQATATVTEENPIPYWTFTDTNSSGAITCAIVADASSGSSNTLRWSIAAGSANSLSAKLTRFVPVAATRNRAFAYSPEVNTNAATNTAIATIRMQAQFYKPDQTTTTGTAIDSGITTFATLGTGNNWLTGSYTTANAAPADAAYCLITITVATAAAGTVIASTVDIPEVRLIRGDQTNLFAEYSTPGTYAPTLVRQVNGTLQISPNAGTGAVQIAGALNLDTRHTITASSASAVQFTRNDTSNRSNITVGRIFPGDQTTRYIEDNGTSTTFSGPVSGASNIFATTSLQSGTTLISGGNFTCGGVILNDTPQATTATTNAGIWVLISGSTYELRRNSSSARYKTNIVDADDVVLEAARKIKPRHYESTIAEESGATRLGFIVEEIEATGLTHAVGYDAEGRPESLDTTALIAALFARVNDLEDRLAALESR